MRVRAGPSTQVTAAGAAWEYLAGSTDLVGLVEAAPPHRLIYLNATAERYAAGPGPLMLGRPLSEAFARAASGPLVGLVSAAAEGGPQRLRGARTRPGSTWNLDAIPVGDAILLIGRPLPTGAAAQQRLEMLLASSDSIWQNDDITSLADAIVTSAAELLPGYACSLALLDDESEEGGGRLAIVAGSEEWLCVGTTVPLTGSLSGRALAELAPVEDAAAQADAEHRSALVAAGVRRMRVVPLLPSRPLPSGRVALGVLSFMSTAAQPFDEDDRRLMAEFGKRASVAIDRAKLAERERVNAERLRIAFDAALALSASLSPEDVATELLKTVVTSLDSDRATLSMVGEDTVTIEATYSPDGESAAWIGRSYALDYIAGQPLVKRALETRLPVFGGPLAADAAAPEFRAQLQTSRYTATLPLLRGEKVEGLLVVSRKAEPPFNSSDLVTLNLIGHAAMLAMSNARLHSEALAANENAEQLAATLQLGIETAFELGEELELHDVSRRLLRRALEVADADRGVLLDVEGDDAVVVDAMGRDGADLQASPGGRTPVDDQPLISLALKTGVAQQAAEVAIDRLPDPYREDIRRLRAFASVPLRFGGIATGVLNLSRYRSESFTTQQLTALTLIGQVAALAIRNAHLFKELREASASKSDFLNMAAHELRTPISVLRGYLSLLTDATLGAVPERWQEPLEILTARAADLNRITEELLLAARVQAGSLGAQRVVFDVVDVVRAAVDDGQAAAGLAGGRVTVTSVPGPLPVFADPVQVRRIVDNLINNAITYSDDAPQVRVGVRQKGDVAVVAVRDRGRGIPDGKRESIFDQFVRVADPGRNQRPGTGLGLYVARALARANGGTLRLVRTTVGQGSEFGLELPIEAGQSPLEDGR